MKQPAGPYETATFIVRLWREDAAATPAEGLWRGLAVHVQSGTERGVQDLSDLLSFIRTWTRGVAPDPEDQ